MEPNNLKETEISPVFYGRPLFFIGIHIGGIIIPVRYDSGTGEFVAVYSSFDDAERALTSIKSEKEGLDISVYEIKANKYN